MRTPRSDVAFSAAVKTVQARLGSRAKFALAERNAEDDFADAIDEALARFITARDSFFLATASAAGQPYVQHRGGPPGFLHVLDEATVAFADFSGNRQYITLGNLAENPKALIFLLDYENRRRVKLWGEARVVEDDPELVSSLMLAGHKAKAERAIVFRVSAWDANCPSHIQRRLTEADVLAATDGMRRRIEELEAELARLRARE